MTVCDDGPGLPSELAAAVAAGGAANWPSASGLGLRLCSEIAAILHARLETRVQEGGGAEFLFTLPAASGAGSVPEAAQTRAEKEGAR